MANKNLSVTVDEQSAGRVDVVVRDLSELSRAQARGLVDHDCVTINGSPCQDAGAAVSTGDLVAICFDPHRRYREKKRTWDDRTFSIVYEDEYLIVVDKAAGTLTVPTENDDINTLVDRVSIYLNHSRRDKVAWVVHRLDRDVSGVLVFAKQELISKALIEQFKQRKPQRIYTAIVAGVIADDEGTFRTHLATGKNLSVYVAPPSRHSEEAITHYRVISRSSDTTVVEVQLETGKRNQIRAHFADAGHPVLGDPRYKPTEAKHQRWIRKRIALHARSLGFQHPISDEQVTFESPLPSALQKFIAGSK